MRSLLEEAAALREAGDAAQALERYQAAYQWLPEPSIGLEVARTQVQLAKIVEACATAAQVSASVGQAGEPLQFVQARAQAQALVERLRPQVPSLTMAVEPLGVAYELRLDGLRVPDAAQRMPLRLNPGLHQVSVQAPGFRPLAERVSLAESQRLQLRVRLVTTAPPLTLAEAPSRPAGSEPEPAERGMQDRGAGARLRGYIALGAGAPVLAAGIVAGILAAIQTDQLKSLCDGRRCPASVASDMTNANTIANLANVTLAFGVLAVGYAVYELLAHPEPAPARARVPARAVRSLQLMAAERACPCPLRVGP